MNNTLLPTIIQEKSSSEVLMLGYMNSLALSKTIETGWVYFWSRSRNSLWKKGETSGNMLKVQEIYTDCDNDTLLIKVSLVGNTVCHTGSKTCFFTKIL
jgi:phosphoribosyl-AMP cyclohydrolase